jgi:hypothetical protein
VRSAYLTNTSRSRQIYWGAVFLLLLAASLLGLYAYLFSPDWFQTAGLMPVALHSPLRADYSADLRGMRPISLNLELISDAARDQAAQEDDPLPELIALLQTPVPTLTSFLAATPTGQTAAPGTATSTQPWTPTSTRSVTPTLTFTVTPSPTKTLRLPTATLTFTRTQKAIPPTATKVPPTAIPVTPTPTRPPLPTPTISPPTGYPPPETPEPTGYPFP